MPLLTGWLWLMAGVLVGMLGLNPLLSIILFDLPTAARFWGRGFLRRRTPLIIYMLTLLPVTTISACVCRAAWLYAATGFRPFLAGVALMLLPVWGNIQRTPGNLAGFLEENAAYLSPQGEHALRAYRAECPLPKLVEPNPRLPRFLPERLLRRLRFRLSIGRFQIVIE